MKTKALLSLLFVSILAVDAGWGQTFPYIANTLAGVNPLGDGGPAASALLEFPSVVGVDAVTGTVYINDLINGRMRKIDPSGLISTFVTGYIADFKVDSTGTIFAVDGNYKAYKIT